MDAIDYRKKYIGVLADEIYEIINRQIQTTNDPVSLDNLVYQLIGIIHSLIENTED